MADDQADSMRRKFMWGKVLRSIYVVDYQSIKCSILNAMKTQTQKNLENF